MATSEKYYYPRPKDLEAIDVTEAFLFEPNNFMIPVKFKDYVDKVILPNGFLNNRWARLAERILADNKEQKELNMLVLMNGGYRFYQDLRERIDEQLEANG